MKPHSLIVAVCFLSTCGTVYAQQDAPRTYSAGGKTINYFLTVFNPPIAVRPDPARMNQDTAINCTVFFLSKLQQGDIKAAAAASEYPDTELKMYEDYKARVGDAEFSKHISQLFNGDRYLYELRIGNEHALISEKQPGGAQIVIEKQGKFFTETLGHESPQFKNLFELVNAWTDGKLQLK
jgi:hypothetical protein